MNHPFLHRWLAVLAALALAGCAVTEPAPTDLQPRTLAQVHRVASAHHGRPALAVVLGGGGLRGFAHVGVLQALEEAGLRPDIVVGTSAGSVVGAAYASGIGLERIRQAALDVKVVSLIDLTWRSGGFIRGDNLARWVDDVTGSTRIEDFPIRFAAVATELQSAQPVLLSQGPAGRSIQASSAVPGIQVPVPYQAGHLVDGGVTSLVPVRFARAMGADTVIAVDIYCSSPRVGSLNVPAVLGRVMQAQSCLVAAPEMAEADLLITPMVNSPSVSDKTAHEQSIRAGYEAARFALRKWSTSMAQATR